MRPDSVLIMWYHLYIGLTNQHLSFETVESVKSYLGNKKDEFQIDSIRISYFFDHVHLVFSLSSENAPIKTAQELMQALSWFLTVQNSANNNYIADYSLITISPDKIERTIEYIENHIDYHLNRKTDSILEKSVKGWANWYKETCVMQQRE